MIREPGLGFDKFGHDAQQPGVSAVEKLGIFISLQSFSPLMSLTGTHKE